MSKKLKIILFIVAIVILYGFYEKDRRKTLLKDFRENKLIICEGKTIQKSRGWYIHHNRFFSNGKEIKTIIFCKSKN